jgi:serine/threonine protein kinase
VEAQPDGDPLVGRTLDDRYLLAGRLGEGGMGAVYRARHTLMNKPCAVKVLTGPAASEELAWRRFQREAQSASRLDHENCIRVTDFGRTADGIAYLVMELLEGRTLAEELNERGALAIPRLVPIGRQIAAALAHAHGLGVVHRDLKPDNVFLVPRGAAGDLVKVLDFGLAKLVGDARPASGSLSTLTEAGSVFGTPEYMSPEQAEGKPLDARADVYSFGVLLYQMMTGMLPFQAASFLAILTKHLTETPISPLVRRPDLLLPRPLASLVMRCLEKTPDRRPATAQAIVDEIDAMAADVVEAARRVPARVAAQPTIELGHTGTLRRRVLVPAAALIAAAALAWVLWPSPPPPPPSPSPPPPPSPSPSPSPSPPPSPSPSPAPVPSPAPSPVRAASPTAADHLRDAARHRAAGNRIKELFHLQQALKLDPRNRDARYRLGAALLEDGQHDLGCRQLVRAGNIGESLRESSGCP